MESGSKRRNGSGREDEELPAFTNTSVGEEGQPFHTQTPAYKLQLTQGTTDYWSKNHPYFHENTDLVRKCNSGTNCYATKKATGGQGTAPEGGLAAADSGHRDSLG